MEEIAGMVGLGVLVLSHMAALGFGFYRGYIQATKDKESQHGTTAP